MAHFLQSVQFHAAVHQLEAQGRARVPPPGAWQYWASGGASLLATRHCAPAGWRKNATTAKNWPLASAIASLEQILDNDRACGDDGSVKEITL